MPLGHCDPGSCPLNPQSTAPHPIPSRGAVSPSLNFATQIDRQLGDRIRAFSLPQAIPF